MYRGVILIIVMFSVVSCGATPYEMCSNTNKQRCWDKDSDGTPEVIQICNGDNWIDVMDCSEQYLFDGGILDDKCVVEAEEAVCKKR